MRLLDHAERLGLVSEALMSLSFSLSCEGSLDTSTIVQVVQEPRTFTGRPALGQRMILSDSRWSDDHGRIYWFRAGGQTITMTASEAYRCLAEVSGPRRWR